MSHISTKKQLELLCKYFHIICISFLYLAISEIQHNNKGTIMRKLSLISILITASFSAQVAAVEIKANETGGATINAPGSVLSSEIIKGREKALPLQNNSL